MGAERGNNLPKTLFRKTRKKGFRSLKSAKTALSFMFMMICWTFEMGFMEKRGKD